MKIFYAKTLFLLLSMASIGYAIGIMAYNYLVYSDNDYLNKFSKIDKLDQRLFTLANNQKYNDKPLVLSIGTSHCRSLLYNSHKYDSVNLTFEGTTFFASKKVLENIESLHMFDAIILCVEPLEYLLNTSHDNLPNVTYNPTKFNRIYSSLQNFRVIDAGLYFRDIIIKLHQASLIALKENQTLQDFDLVITKRIALHRSIIISQLPQIEKNNFHAVTKEYLQQKSKCVFLLNVPLHEKYLQKIPELSIKHHGTQVETINIPENYIFFTEQQWYKDGDHLNPVGMNLFSHHLESFLETVISKCNY